jgi:hypothetical protein
MWELCLFSGLQVDDCLHFLVAASAAETEPKEYPYMSSKEGKGPFNEDIEDYDDLVKDKQLSKNPTWSKFCLCLISIYILIVRLELNCCNNQYI